MRVTLVRHGDALPGHDLGDAGRSLSAEGRREALAAGRALAARGVRPTEVWCSPLVRAVQTAEIIVGALAYPGIVCARADIYPSSSPGALADELRRGDDERDLLIVSHQPLTGALASELVGYSVGGVTTGAALRIERARGDSRAHLRWRWIGRFLD